MTCIPREALISGLVRRVRDGYLVTRGDVDALLRAGVPKAQLREAFAGDSDAFAHARALIG